MTEDTTKNSPDFNEFWDELIEKSDWAKKNAGAVATEFKNLGILKSKPQIKSEAKTESANPAVPSRPPTVMPPTIGYMQKVLWWLVSTIIAVLLVTLVLFFVKQPERALCVLNFKTWSNLKATCFINFKSCDWAGGDCGDSAAESSIKKEPQNQNELPEGEIKASHVKSVETDATPTSAPISTSTMDKSGNAGSVIESRIDYLKR